jgi:hypothetical protein
MTISSTSNRQVFSGNGVTTSFPAGFRVDLSTDLVVIYTDASGNNSTLSPGQYTTDGHFGSAYPTGPTVTYNPAAGPIATGTTLTLYRSVPITQGTSLNNQGAMWPSAIEAGLDKATMLAQQLQDQFNRTLLVGPAEANTLSLLPNATARANSLLAFGASGQPYAAPLSGSLVAVSNGFSQIFSAPVAGSVMGVDYLKETNVDWPLGALASIWSFKTRSFVGISREFSSADGGTGDAPFAALTAYGVNNNSGATVLGLLSVGRAGHNNDNVQGANIIGACGPSMTGVTLVGLEIDLEPGVGTTLSGGGALFINVFNVASAGPAIQLGNAGGGTFTNGFMVGGIASIGTAFGILGGGQTMDSMLNSSGATFNTAAAIFGNTHRIRYSGTASTHAFTYMDASNNLRHVNGAGSFVWREHTDTSTIGSMDDSGNLSVIGSYRFSGTQVVGPRDTGWVAMTGTTDKSTVFDTGSVTLAQLAARVKTIQAALTTHGLIGA